jgi:CubicO group peptidase (beta-lactamase class C family)
MKGRPVITNSTRQFTRFLVLFSILAIAGAFLTQHNGAIPVLAQAAPTAAATQQVAPPDYWPTKGWQTSSPAAQGVDAEMLAAMLKTVEESKLGLHSLLIIRNGYLVSETYFEFYDQKLKHELWSCTKSFIATLVGIAIDKKYIDGTKLPALGFFPDLTFANLDKRKEAMTLDDLLTMQSGLDWDDDRDNGRMYQSQDWTKYVLGLPMRDQPGTQFEYCTGCSHVLSAILQQKTGMKTEDFAKKELFEPLGISDFAWDIDRSGVTYGGWGLRITPRDMAKLGYLYLHNGMWDGKQIVSADWIKAATSPRAKTDSTPAAGYGYQWWIFPSVGAYSALGRDGQTIFVVPRLNLIVVTTALAPTHNHDGIFNLIEKYIVPAVKKS